MIKNNLSTLLKENRSYRSYDESFVIQKKTIISILSNTRFVASRKNIQPLKYYYVLEKEKVKKIVNTSKWGALIKDIQLPPINHYPTAIIIVYLDTTIEEFVEKVNIEIGMVAQTILLSAVELGLGGCINLSFDKEKLNNIVCVNPQYRPVLIIALGKADEEVEMVRMDTTETDYKRINGIHYVPKRELSKIILNEER